MQNNKCIKHILLDIKLIGGNTSWHKHMKLEETLK